MCGCGIKDKSCTGCQSQKVVTDAKRPVDRFVMWAVGKWDWMIYRLAYGSMRRMCAKEPAFALILERWIQEWRKQNPMPEHLEQSVEQILRRHMRSR